VTRAGMGF